LTPYAPWSIARMSVASLTASSPHELARHELLTSACACENFRSTDARSGRCVGLPVSMSHSRERREPWRMRTALEYTTGAFDSSTVVIKAPGSATSQAPRDSHADSRQQGSRAGCLTFYDSARGSGAETVRCAGAGTRVDRGWDGQRPHGAVRSGKRRGDGGAREDHGGVRRSVPRPRGSCGNLPRRLRTSRGA
jgi:hypothetical protein